jgi:predicted nucleic acid-binding protein
LYSTALLEELDKVVHRPKHWKVIDTTDYLLTGDADLLALKEFGKTKIMQLTDFIKLMKK